jgi:YidC/Oxa1 family membrane protein insertase
MMGLTRQAGVKPMLGCLPMLLQMPIWIALWTGIQAAVELRHAAFLPVWITDLAAPDALVSFSGSVEVPLLGGLIGPIASLNLLPLLLTVAFFLQQKFSPTSAAAGTDQQAATQKQMMYMMPAMMLLFFYNAPSGLTLYIMTSSAVGVVEQYFIRRHLQHREVEQQATETLVRTRLRGKRKKKSKPFFRHMR